MKKFFTSMGLAAMSFLAATPVIAQQSLTANQAEAVVKTVFPAVMEQVKMVSGLDIQAIAEGNMDWTLYSRMPAVTMQPDSAHINALAIMAAMQDDYETETASSRIDMSGILGSLNLDKVKVTFSDYTKINYAVSDLSTEINLPGTTTVDLILPGSIKVLIEAEATSDPLATMPFKKLVVKSEVNPQLATVLAVAGSAMGDVLPEGMLEMLQSLLQSGTILTINQSSANGINTVTTEMSDTGLILAQLISGMIDDDDDDEEDGETIIYPKYSKATDLTKMATDKYYTVTTTDYLPNGTAIVDEVETVYNPTQTLPLIADSIVTKTYLNDGSLNNINKRVFQLSSAAGANGNTITKVAIDSITYYSDNGTYSLVKKDSTIMEGNQLPLDRNNITMSIIQSVIADMATLENVYLPFSMVQHVTNDEGEYTKESEISMIMERIAAATTAEADTIHTEIMLADFEDSSEELDEASAKVICIGLTKDQAIICVHMGSIDAEEENKIATIYAKSNLLSIATDNEEIAAPQSDVTFGFEANGIYVNNCKQGRYTIVDMKGRIVANGVIAGEGAYIATPQLTRGSIYVIAVQDEKGLVKAVKFAK